MVCKSSFICTNINNMSPHYSALLSPFSFFSPTHLFPLPSPFSSLPSPVPLFFLSPLLLTQLLP